MSCSTRALCEGDHNEEFPKCGWCIDVDYCKVIQKERANPIGKHLNVNRCPQADYDGYPCYRCKLIYMFDEHIRCPHNVVHERGERWWIKEGDEEP